jgi:hypothetical protein
MEENNPRVPMVPRVSFHTVLLTVRYGPAPVAGTVCAGTGTVWENPTRGLPVRNPISIMLLVSLHSGRLYKIS